MRMTATAVAVVGTLFMSAANAPLASITNSKSSDTATPVAKVATATKKAEIKTASAPLGKTVVVNEGDYLTPAPAPSYSYTPSSAPAVAGGSVWDSLAACESGGNWAINTGNGFYGGLQFTLSSWQAVGGSGYPNQASREEQIMRGQMLQARGGWGNWPACSAKLGL
jgi:hypothetical protein